MSRNRNRNFIIDPSLLVDTPDTILADIYERRMKLNSHEYARLKYDRNLAIADYFEEEVPLLGSLPKKKDPFQYQRQADLDAQELSWLTWAIINGTCASIALMGIILYIGPCLAFGTTVATQALFLLGGCVTNFFVAYFFAYDFLKSFLGADPYAAQTEADITHMLQGKQYAPAGTWENIKAYAPTMIFILVGLLASVPFMAAASWPSQAYDPATQLLLNSFAKTATGFVCFFMNFYAVKFQLWPFMQDIYSMAQNAVFGLQKKVGQASDKKIQIDNGVKAMAELREALAVTMEHYFATAVKNNAIPHEFLDHYTHGVGGTTYFRQLATLVTEQHEGQLRLKSAYTLKQHSNARTLASRAIGATVALALVSGMIGYAYQLWVATQFMPVIQAATIAQTLHLTAFGLFGMLPALNLHIISVLVCGAPYGILALRWIDSAAQSVFNLAADIFWHLKTGERIDLPAQFSLMPTAAVAVTLIMVSLACVSFATSAQFVLAMNISASLKTYLYYAAISSTALINSTASVNFGDTLVNGAALNSSDVDTYRNAHFLRIGRQFVADIRDEDKVKDEHILSFAQNLKQEGSEVDRGVGLLAAPKAVHNNRFIFFQNVQKQSNESQLEAIDRLVDTADRGLMAAAAPAA